MCRLISTFGPALQPARSAWLRAETPIYPPVYTAWASPHRGERRRHCLKISGKAQSGLAFYQAASCSTIPEAGTLPSAVYLRSHPCFIYKWVPSLTSSPGTSSPLRQAGFSQALRILVSSRGAPLHLGGFGCSGYVCSWSPARSTAWRVVADIGNWWFLHVCPLKF